MSRPRMSLASLMALVLVFGIGIAALRDATELWASVLFTLTLGLLGIAALGATFRRGPSRAFWAGSTLFGWGYMLLSFGPWFDSEVRPHLLTTKLIGRLDEETFRQFFSVLKCPDDNVIVQGTGNLNYVGGGFQRWHSSPVALSIPEIEHRHRIGHSLWSLLSAYIGGLIASFFAGRNYRSRAG